MFTLPAKQIRHATHKRYAGFIGLGLMYLWCTALLAWIDWTQGGTLFVQCIGVAGFLLANLSGISVFLYVNKLENQLKATSEINAFNEAQAQEWKNQSQLAISFLEKERAKLINQNKSP